MLKRTAVTLVVIAFAALTASTTHAQDTTLTATITTDTLIQGNLCYKFLRSMNGVVTGSDFEYIENDSLRSKGYQDPGMPLQFTEYVLSPLNPTVGTTWWGNWGDDPARVTVSDCLWVEVPAGIFLVYRYDYVDSLTQDYVGYLLCCLGVGWVSAKVIDEADTAELVLDSLNLIGGSGPIPLAVGNFWQFIPGVHTLVGIQPEKVNTPMEFTLSSCFPNPFNPSTVTSYELRIPSYVKLDVFSISGAWITTLAEGWKTAGVHEVIFDGSGLPSGMYLARLQAGERVRVNKMVLLK